MAEPNRSKTPRVALFGGSFNPIHVAHVAIARAVRSGLSLDRVLLVPSARPPHKNEDLAPAEHRLAMTRLAVDEIEGLEVSAIEFERDGPSYTIDLVRAFREQATPGTEVFFIIGADSLHDLPTWRDAAMLAREVAFVVVDRPGWDVESELQRLAPRFGAAWADTIRRNRVATDPMPVSSTDLRARLARGEDVSDEVPEKVARYVREHGLYGTTEE